MSHKECAAFPLRCNRRCEDLHFLYRHLFGRGDSDDRDDEESGGSGGGGDDDHSGDSGDDDGGGGGGGGGGRGGAWRGGALLKVESQCDVMGVT